MYTPSLIALSALAFAADSYAAVLAPRAVECPAVSDAVDAAAAQATATRFCSSYLGITTRTRVMTSTTATTTMCVPSLIFVLRWLIRSQHGQQGHLCHLFHLRHARRCDQGQGFDSDRPSHHYSFDHHQDADGDQDGLHQVRLLISMMIGADQIAATPAPPWRF